MPSKPWFKRIASSDLLSVHLIQCDIAKHTVWFDNCRIQGKAAYATEAKRELARNIERAVTPEFAQVFWRGDGGLYAAREGTIDGDKIVTKALKLRTTFLKWQKSRKWRSLHLESLSLRLSCHTCKVWIEKETPYWASTDLNRFVKYERLLSHEDTLAITDSTFQHLKKRGPQFSSCFKDIIMSDERPEKWRVYYSDQVTPTKSVETAIDWFRNKFQDEFSFESTLNAESQRFAFGESIVLAISGSREDSLDIELQETTTPPFDFLTSDELALWRQYENEIKNEFQIKDQTKKRVDQERLSPLELRTPIKDFPISKITVCPLAYSRARSFLRCLSERKAVWDKLVDRAVDYVPEAPRRPGILAVHMVLITTEEKQGPLMILSQRTTRQKDIMTFYSGQWSASVQEQCERGDGSIRATAARGLKEELLGSQATNASINIASIFLHRSILNLTLAVVCRTSLSFNEIHQLWLGCEDHEEHSQIVALPLRTEIVKECVRKGMITDNIKKECVVHKESQKIWDDTREWELDPTAPFRMALALRALGE